MKGEHLAIDMLCFMMKKMVIHSHHHVPQQQATFDIHNSPLSEAAVVGFEYGYNVENKGNFNIWEAQYGDFSNMSQMMFDNFLSSSRAKWGDVQV